MGWMDKCLGGWIMLIESTLLRSFKFGNLVG